MSENKNKQGYSVIFWKHSDFLYQIQILVFFFFFLSVSPMLCRIIKTHDWMSFSGGIRNVQGEVNPSLKPTDVARACRFR